MVAGQAAGVTAGSQRRPQLLGLAPGEVVITQRETMPSRVGQSASAVHWGMHMAGWVWEKARQSMAASQAPTVPPHWSKAVWLPVAGMSQTPWSTPGWISIALPFWSVTPRQRSWPVQVVSHWLGTQPWKQVAGVLASKLAQTPVPQKPSVWVLQSVPTFSAPATRLQTSTVQSAGQFTLVSPASQVPLLLQVVAQSTAQVVAFSPASQVPLPQEATGQSAEQLALVSPASQVPLPQVVVGQSAGQLVLVSPVLQVPLLLQVAAGQSAEQLAVVSPESQVPLPQEAAQSAAQEVASSPASQASLPHTGPSSFFPPQAEVRAAKRTEEGEPAGHRLHGSLLEGGISGSVGGLVANLTLEGKPDGPWVETGTT